VQKIDKLIAKDAQFLEYFQLLQVRVRKDLITMEEGGPTVTYLINSMCF
jgi:hypothetical protein